MHRHNPSDITGARYAHVQDAFGIDFVQWEGSEDGSSIFICVSTVGTFGTDWVS